MHRFEQRDGCALCPRTENESIECAENRLCVRNGTCPKYSIRNPQLGGALIESITLGTFADHTEMP
jgi:hypothetical protein